MTVPSPLAATALACTAIIVCLAVAVSPFLLLLLDRELKQDWKPYGALVAVLGTGAAMVSLYGFGYDEVGDWTALALVAFAITAADLADRAQPAPASWRRWGLPALGTGAAILALVLKTVYGRKAEDLATLGATYADEAEFYDRAANITGSLSSAVATLAVILALRAKQGKSEEKGPPAPGTDA